MPVAAEVRPNPPPRNAANSGGTHGKSPTARPDRPPQPPMPDQQDHAEVELGSGDGSAGARPTAPIGRCTNASSFPANRGTILASATSSRCEHSCPLRLRSALRAARMQRDTWTLASGPRRASRQYQSSFIIHPSTQTHRSHISPCCFNVCETLVFETSFPTIAPAIGDRLARWPYRILLVVVHHYAICRRIFHVFVAHCKPYFLRWCSAFAGKGLRSNQTLRSDPPAHALAAVFVGELASAVPRRSLHACCPQTSERASGSTFGPGPPPTAFAAIWPAWLFQTRFD